MNPATIRKKKYKEVFMELSYVIDLGLEWPEGRSKRQTTDTVVIHHTVGNYGTPEAWRDLHESRVASPTHRGVSYNYLVLQNGDIYVGRGLEYEGGSVRNDRTNGLNSRCVAIAMDGDMRKETLPTPRQIESAVRLTRDVLNFYGLPVSAVLGHNEVQVYDGAKPTGALYPTLCPCMDMKAFRQAVCGGTYTVQKGDTLYSIAKKLLGSSMRYKELMAINGLTGTAIRAGSVLRIPGSEPDTRELYLDEPLQRGEDVKKLQERLSLLGYDVGSIDGVYGKRTDGAVKLFRCRAAQLAQTVIVDEPMRVLLGL
jgi:N-acetyl-anhydromuramyl-L-alanine amidase AmpD